MSRSACKSLGTDVLRDVSRSFYLTLRALSAGMREATSVGYLLARASDTIADCGGEREARLALLEQFAGLLAGGQATDFFSRCAAMAGEEGLKEGERVLMGRLEEVFVWWQTLPDGEREAVRVVVETIVSGQKWDLERFPPGEVTALAEEAELEDYCYRVAGCVGEFWTEVGFLSDDSFADRSPAEMKRLGCRYGKGLQLVNILRDEAEDEVRGRRYLVGDRSAWLARAREYLQDGLTYSRAVRGWRARLASVLPALLGLETLALLEKRPLGEAGKKAKVSRQVVRECLWQAVIFRKEER
ncbi:squalene/phytoene synthase family protein [Roseibacillus ishigakijimensis]|uniref:Squalene/phytoene synthase family protein n=1 Tax=Roseibacillus ishigakijimensis TaxID=454146 RepID=A0A934RNW6_9BACT|nr:squalene/phytoene synthase family protein [Roseibacillus ishigakijimensis]MBK1835252.1 squalene/phytoene synthase family protein [Roseibacillus ishigakijimensis]